MKVELSPSYLMMEASPSLLIFSVATRSATSLTQSQMGQVYAAVPFAVRRRALH